MSEPTPVRVYSGQILAIVTHLKHALEMNGIACEVRGEYRAGAVGELPVTDAWPELWILDPADAGRAADVLSEALEPAGSELPCWECPQCREQVESQFGVCWNCGTRGVEPVESS